MLVPAAATETDTHYWNFQIKQAAAYKIAPTGTNSLLGQDDGKEASLPLMCASVEAMVYLHNS
jgi:hypothetical protein